MVPKWIHDGHSFQVLPLLFLYVVDLVDEYRYFCSYLCFPPTITVCLLAGLVCVCVRLCYVCIYDYYYCVAFDGVVDVCAHYTYPLWTVNQVDLFQSSICANRMDAKLIDLPLTLQ